MNSFTRTPPALSAEQRALVIAVTALDEIGDLSRTHRGWGDGALFDEAKRIARHAADRVRVLVPNACAAMPADLISEES